MDMDPYYFQGVVLPERAPLSHSFGFDSYHLVLNMGAWRQIEFCLVTNREGEIIKPISSKRAE